MKKVALIGAGAIAEEHVRAISDAAPRAKLVAAVDPKPDHIKAFCNAHVIPHAFTGTHEMLAAVQPEIVVICTPPATHLPLSLACLEAGAWVLCEKPLVGSLAELDAITAAEARTDCYVASVFQQRFGAGGQHLKQLIQTGSLGRPLVAICQTTWYRNQQYYEVPWRGKWRTELGGTSLVHGIHAMDFTLWLLGRWRKIHAIVGTLDHAIEVDDAAVAIVELENGALLSIVNSAVSPRQETVVRLDFQRVTAEVHYLYTYDNSDWRFTLPPGIDAPDLLARCLEIPTGPASPWTAQFLAFLGSMDRGERPAVGGADLRGTMEFVTALYKSAFTRLPVLRSSIGPDDPFYHALNGVIHDGA